MTQLATRNGVYKNGDQEIHYDVIGDGKPIVMLGGGPGAHPEYLKSTAFAIGSVRQAIVLHQRGTGRSHVALPDCSNINVNILVEDIESLRNHLGLSELTLVGHSWGGMLAMAYAAKYPQLAESLILVCSGGLNQRKYDYYSDNIRAYLNLAERNNISYWEDKYNASGDWEDRYEHYRIVAPVLVYDRSKADESQKILLSINLLTEELIGQSIRAGDCNVARAMSRFDKPVSLIFARQDYIGEGVAYEAQATFPLATLQWIERSGHFPWLDNPGAFFQAISDALNEDR